MNGPFDSKGPKVDDDEVDGLLESLTTDDGYREEQPTLPIDPEPLTAAARPPAPASPAPAPARPSPADAPRLPRPGAPRFPRPGSDAATAQPPAVNPAGPPRREPFPPATSPAPGAARPAPAGRPASMGARPGPRPAPAKPRLPGGAGIDDAEIDAALMPLSFSPPSSRPLPPSAGKAQSSVPPPVAAAPSSAPPSARADSFRPPVFDEHTESLDELDAVEVPSAPDVEEAPATRQSASLDLPRPVEQESPPSGRAETTFEEWDDQSETSIRATEEDLEPSESQAVELDAASIEELSAGPELGGSETRDEPRGSVATSPAVDGGSERPAAAHLGDHRLIDAWVSRAEWFEAEAHAAEDVQSRARLLVAASELWAMAGNTARARDAAKRAVQAAPSVGLAGRQARALAAIEGDWKAVALALDAESRAAGSDEARAHAAYVSAEVQRLALADAQGADRRLDVLLRAAPADPRPHLFRLATELGAGAGVPKIRWPDEPAIEPLRAAAAELSRLRIGSQAEGARTPPVAFEDARRALGAGDRAAAGAALKDLAGVPGIGDGALFLAAALLAPDPTTRSASIDALGALLDRSPSVPVRRALSSRALEQGDAEAMSRALAERAGDTPAFQPSDRVALSALAGDTGPSLTSAAEALLDDETLRPLAAAALSASSAEASVPVGDPATRSRLTLGRRLAGIAGAEALSDAVHAVRAAAPDDPLGRILALELDAGAGATSAVAAELTRLAPAEQPSDGKLAAALLEELAGHTDVARRHYSGALATPAVAETAARAMLQPEDASAADLLATVASALGDETTPRQALLLYEAAVRSGAENPAATEDFLARAHEACPDLPFAARLGGDLARARGDVPKVLEWLGRQRDSARDPIARALDLVREALLVADDDPHGAAAKVEEALEARPDDVALRDLAERMNPIPSLERGRWRERIAEGTPLARTRSWLLFEAASEYERQGAPDDAARAARAAAAAGGSGLAAVAAERRDASTMASDAGALAKDRALEQELLATDGDEDLEALATRLAELPDRGEATAHARLAARMRLKTQPWEATRELVARAAAHTPRSLWVLRQLSTHARVSGEDALLLETEQELATRVGRPLDAATLLLRGAEAAARLGKTDDSLGLLGRTLETIPDHLVARDQRARMAEQSGDFVTAAEDLEAIAKASSVDAHRGDAWYGAGVLWLDKAKNPERGLSALEQAAALDVTKGDVFDRLQLLYVERGDRGKLAALLESRISRTDAPEERIALEVTRGRALADIGDRDSALRALGAALEANPDHTDALEVYAGLCADDGDWKSAEESWIRLARIVTDPEKQADIYGRLAGLYDSRLPNPTRAEICYREILKRRPNDLTASQGLVQVYARLGDVVKAVQLQTELVDRATGADEKRDRTIALSVLYDEAAKDKKSAFAILEKARKAWPHDSAVLRAVAEHHRRHGETAALGVLLDRAAAEARRALAHGRFDLAFFGILETAASMRGQEDAAAVAGATLAALEARPEAPLGGAGGAATRPDLDDLLAPELLSPALRALLHKLPTVFDAAYPVDLKSLRVGPLPPSAAELGGEIRAVAESLGVRSLELLVSPAIGPVFLPASCAPPRLVIGQALLETADEEARYFALVRSIKMLQGGAAAFTRIAPIDLWPAMAALLSVLAKGYQPQGVDAAKLAEAKRRIESALPARLDDDLATLALEVGGTIGNRASQLGQAVGQWASRTALLAVGSPSIGLRGVALATGQAEGVPTEVAERLKWLLRQPEARDLAVFSVSDAYAEARRRVGLGSSG